MALRLKSFSFRFAEQVLNSKLALKREIESLLIDEYVDVSSLSRPTFNQTIEKRFVDRGWKSQPFVFDEPSARMDFLKDRVGIEVGFGHASFVGIDLLKFDSLVKTRFEEVPAL